MSNPSVSEAMPPVCRAGLYLVDATRSGGDSRDWALTRTRDSLGLEPPQNQGPHGQESLASPEPTDMPEEEWKKDSHRDAQLHRLAVVDLLHVLVDLLNACMAVKL